MPLPPAASLPIQAPGPNDSYRDHSPAHEYPSDYERSQDESGALSYAGRFGSGAEDAAHELERSVLEDSYDYPASHVRHKVKDLIKRPASDTNSDFDAPKRGDDKTGPALKKRKLDKDVVSYVDVHESISTHDGLSSSAVSKLKGRDKQIQREASYDSLSLTPKSSRAKATKKKFGLASEFELELASRAPSASGDVTPAISRPTSPVVSASTFVYELDEQIPPLKKAKKMDESAIIKRVKALEEAQRKVWTNIARREIAKV
jgi:DNA helicase INO80